MSRNVIPHACMLLLQKTGAPILQCRKKPHIYKPTPTTIKCKCDDDPKRRVTSDQNRPAKGIHRQEIIAKLIILDSVADFRINVVVI